MTDEQHPDRIDWSVTTWEGSRRELIERWSRMTLDEILEAQEEMAELAAELAAPDRGSGIVSPPTAEHDPAVVREKPSEYTSTHGPNDIALPGCTPEPLMAYLKTLGIFRLISEQKDKDARGWWKDDNFWLRSPMLFKYAPTERAKREALMKFFLEQYQPTPIVGPWAGGSGFFKKDNKKAVEELQKSKAPRVALYAKAIQKVQAILKEERIGDKPKDDDKTRLLHRYRRELPDEVVAWMDAAMVLHNDGQGFAPVLGTGGNDGRLDFTQNFMQRIVALGFHNGGEQRDQSKEWLAQSLFVLPARLSSASVGQFAPGRAGGPNSTQGMEGDPTDNPWEFILTLEGALMLAGAAVRRFGGRDLARVAFPFTVRAVAVAFDSSASKDEAESRGELWLPLWTRPTSAGELRQIFGEGRAEISGRPARNGTDFARAVAGLGIDRGIADFSRVAFFKRSGKAFLAVPIGRFAVNERREADLLRQIDPWLNAFRRAAVDKYAPPRFSSSVRRLDLAIFEFCKHGGSAHFQRILIALGRIERELTIAEKFRDEKKLHPQNGLSAEWLDTADEGSREFAVARALVSIHDPEMKIGPFRSNLEAVDWKKRCRDWAEKDRSVVWNAVDLATNLANVLQRRMMDGTRAGCETPPIASRFAAPLDMVGAFISGELDDNRIEDLLWGLMLIDNQNKRSPFHQGESDSLVPRAYALLKLLFLPRPLVLERRGDGPPFVRLLRASERVGIVIRPEPSILNLLRGGRLGEACVTAMRRLRASGLDPMPRPIQGRVRDIDWKELDDMGNGSLDPKRLAAALLIPIHDNAVNKLFRSAICGDGIENGEAYSASGMNSQGGKPS